MLRKEVQLHLQTAMRIHFENACRVFKETNSKLEEKVSALELKQAEIDQEKSTLQKQVQELKSANAVLEAKVTAQEKNVSELKSGKFAWRKMNFSVILKNAKSGSGKEIYSSPFVTAVAFSLQRHIDQKDRMNVSERFINRPIQRPNSDAYISTIGSRRFISHKNLMTSQYLVEDTMFLQVEVCPRL